MPTLTYLEAISQGLREEIKRDENVFCLGEDIGQFGGAFKVTKGQSTTYDTQADSGNTVTRHFCGKCGSNLWSVPNAIPDLLVVKAGSLDDPSWLKPGMSIYCDSAQPWAVIPEGIPRFPKMPPM